MARFDPEAIRQRSWRRYERAIKRRKDDRAAEAAWFQDQQSILDLCQLTNWCASKSLSVEFKRIPNGIFDRNSSSIAIASNAKPLRQVAYLLHECGHYLVSLISDEDDRFKMGYPLGEGFTSERGFVHKLACIEEEFEAWHRGWKLACRLDLNIRREQFDDVRRDCLKSYIQWGNRRSTS